MLLRALLLFIPPLTANVITGVVALVPALTTPTPVSLVANASASIQTVETVDADTAERQVEASIENVESDLKKLDAFDNAVRRSLESADRTRADVQHAVADFRRQSELERNERDACKAKVVRLEEEVATLQRSIKTLEAEKATLISDKATLTEANRKVLAQLSSMFTFGQSVQNGLALSGLAAANNSTDSPKA